MSDLGFSLLGKATANLPQALQLMVPPTKSPYGPVTKDICYNFKVATNCAIGTIVHGIELLMTQAQKLQRGKKKKLAEKMLLQDARMTDGSPMAGGTSKHQLTFNERSGRQAFSALPLVLTDDI